MLQKMYDDALLVIQEHNSVIGVDKPGYIKPDYFLENIKAAGGTTEDRLKNLSYENILLCMPPLPIKPIAIAKDIAKIFRGKEEKSVSTKKADKMSLLELIQAYDTAEDNAVSKRLKNISRGENFLVFNNNTVDVDTSLKLLQEVRQGYDGRNTIILNGEVKQVNKVGDKLNNFADENPLYKNRPLRPDGTCDQTNRSWDGISLKTRQLIRIAIDLGILKDISIDKAHSIMDMVMNDESKLAIRYPAAVIEYEKLGSLGKLPVLKLILKQAGNGPFNNPKKVNTTTWN